MKQAIQGVLGGFDQTVFRGELMALVVALLNAPANMQTRLRTDNASVHKGWKKGSAMDLCLDFGSCGSVAISVA